MADRAAVPLLAHLQLSLDWAVRHAAYYRDLLGPEPVALSSLDDFAARVPILDRATLAARTEDFTDHSEPPVAVTVTGGTTSPGGRPMLMFVNDLELTAYADLLTRHLAATARGGPAPVTLRVSNGSHGVPLAPRLPGSLTLPLRKPDHLDAIIELLGRRLAFAGVADRVTQLLGSVPLVQLLTLLLIERQRKASEFDIGRVVVWAAYLPDRWRRILEDYWGCPVHEYYGLSEVPGMYCVRTGSGEPYSFAGPTYLEVVAPARDEPVTAGFGRLVATPLVPFGCSRPVLRYDTGDLVRVVDRPAGAGAKRFELHGRLADAVVLDSPAGPLPLLSAIELQSAVSELAAVNTDPYPEVALLGVRSRVGWPVHRVRFDHDQRLLVDVELRFSPHEFPADASAAAEQLEARLLAASDRLADRVASGAVHVRVVCHPPGAIGPGRVV